MQAWLVALALGLGLLVGVVMATVATLAARRGARAAKMAAEELPDGLAAVLRVLNVPAVLVNGSNLVLAQSPSAAASGLVTDRIHPMLVDVIDDVRVSGEQVHVELDLPGPVRDAVRHLWLTASRVGVRYVLVVAEDRTETVRLDAVRRDFIANVSHELKTPIGAVSLLAEAIDSAAEDPVQVRRFADRLGQEAQRLGGLTQDIIELSRVQDAGPLLEADLVELDAIIAQAIDQNRVIADAKRIALVRGGAKGMLVWGHAPTLVVAIHNLIVNAIQHSPDRSRVGIGVADHGDTVSIAVSDHGPGIPEDEQDRIFERFFRSDPARSRTTGGTGLGLSIVKHAVANHGGVVEVWSQPGSGATFTIRLPRANQPAGAAAAAAATTMRGTR